MCELYLVADWCLSCTEHCGVVWHCEKGSCSRFISLLNWNNRNSILCSILTCIVCLCDKYSILDGFLKELLAVFKSSE
jgi:hypothetical protein